MYMVSLGDKDYYRPGRNEWDWAHRPATSYEEAQEMIQEWLQSIYDSEELEDSDMDWDPDPVNWEENLRELNGYISYGELAATIQKAN